MKAFLLKQPGGAEQLQLAVVPKPVLQFGEVLVKVHAISINPVDVYVREDSQALQTFLLPPPGQDAFILDGTLLG